MATEVDSLGRMQALARQWEEQGDRRAIFLSCYAMMTANMLEAIQNGEFHDGDWVGDWLGRFAEYYFDALQAFEQSPELAPAIWRFTFESAINPKTNVIENLLLGVNAHINYDLCFCLAEMLRSDWDSLDEQGRRDRYLDHCHVNEVIARTVDAVQDQVVERYNPEMDFADRFLGRLDEWLISRLIKMWREHVWDGAVRLLEAMDEAERLEIAEKIEKAAMVRADTILIEGWRTE